MSILTVCPNVNLPEWKALVEKVGTTQAYKEYLKNQQEVPTFEQIQYIELETLNPTKDEKLSFSIAQDKPFILPGFEDYAQQLEAIRHLEGTLMYDLENAKPQSEVYYELKENKKVRITEEEYNSLTKEEYKKTYTRRVKTKSATYDEVAQSYRKELEGEDYKGNPDIEIILNNYDALIEISKERLEKIGLLKKKKTFEDDVEAVVEGNDNSKADYTYRKDDWVFNFDQKSNALKELKKFLYFIPVTIYKNGLHQNVYSYLGDGNFKYMSYDEVFEQLHAILAGNDVINTWESMEAKMKEYEIAKPWIKQIFANIEAQRLAGKDVEMLKRQFVVGMSSSFTNYHTMLWKNSMIKYGDEYIRSTDRYNFRFIKTDRDGIINTIVAEWTTNLRTLKQIESDGTTIKLGKEYIDQTIQAFKDLEKTRSIADIKEALKLIGVDIQDSTANDILDGKLNKLAYNTQFTSKSGLFYLIIDRLKGLGASKEEVEDNFDKFNPLVSNSAIRRLAELDSKYRPLLYSNSLRNSNGDTVYNYTMNKFLTTEYKKLVNDPEYAKQQLEISFNAPIVDDNKNVLYETWLHQIANKKGDFDFELEPFESLKEQQGTQDNQQLKELEATSLEATKVNLILNGQNIREGKSRLLRYLFLVPDKTTGYTIKATGLKPDVSFFADGDFLIRKSNIDALYQIFASEHNRIISAQSKTFNSDYQEGSKLFYFFPKFNNDKNLRTTSGLIKNPTDKVGDQTIEEYIKEELTKLIKSEVKDQIKKWNDIKLIDGKNIYIDNGYLTSKEVKSLDDKNQITYAAYDYILNSMLAKYNFHQVFAGDPALFYSGSKNTIPKVWDEISKRLAGLIAPGKDLYLENENEDYIHLTLADNKRASANYDEYVKILGVDGAFPYKEGELNSTDAHELVTFRERLKTMYNSGEAGMTTKMYNQLLERYNKDRDNFKLTKEEQKVFNGGAEKPVYFGKRISKDNDVIYNDYVKSSAVPLLPSFTKGLEIDKLRKAMEALEDANPGKTVRVAYKSAVKLGGTKPINIWKDKSSNIVDDLKFNEGDYIFLKRSNFRIQQELPYDENKQEVIKGSQPTKLLFDSLLSLKGVDGKFFNEKYEEYVKLHEQLFKDAYNKLATKLLNDETKQVDIVKLAKLLKEEAKARNYDFNEIEFLELTKGQDEFITALWANPSANKFESLIASLYTNGIVRQKMHGRSYVLMPEEGLKGESEDIVYTADYTGELKQDEVLIPWNYADSIKKYINKETGRLEISNIDPDLLKLFGFRIPNQGHNSMTSMKVVGFLPKYMRDTIVASRDLIAQMGQDFDVDKLYVYDYYTDVVKKNNEKNKIVKKDNNIKNKLLDLHKDIINHPYVKDLMRQPLGNIANDKVVKDLKALKQKTINNYLNPSYDSDKYLESLDGKAMVGITSLHNTFNSLLNQQDAIYLKHRVNGEYQRKVFHINYRGVDHELNDLSNPLDLNGIPKNVGIRNTQSGAVDNAKDPVLSYINLNMTTASTYSLLSLLGVPNDYIQQYLAQPSLVEYVKLVKYGKSTFNDEFKSNDDILNELLTKYGEKVATKIDLQVLNQMIDSGEKTLTEEALIYGYSTKTATTPLPIIKGENNSEIMPYLIQYMVLYNFKQYKAYGEFLDRAKASINLDTSGIGQSFIVVKDKVERYDENILKSNEYVENIDKLVNNTVAQHQIENSLLKAQEHFANLLPYNKKTFEIITESYQAITLKKNINEDDKYKLWTAFKSFLFSKFYPTVEEDRERLMYWNKEETSFAQRTKRLKEHPKYKNNPFIQRLNLDTKVDITGRNPSLVFYEASKEKMIDEYDVLTGYRELFDDPMTKAWAEDSVKYFFINGGIQGAKEWGKYIPAPYLEKVGFSEFTRNIEFNNEELIGYREGNLVNVFITQYFQHNPFTLKQLKDTTIPSIKGVITLPPIDSDKAPQNLKDSSGMFYTPIFRVKEKVYVLNNVDKKYYLKSNLGDSHYKQYNGNLKKIVAATEPTPQNIVQVSTNNLPYNIEIIDRYTPQLLKQYPGKYYVFGDNTEETGKGGQAIIRDEMNAVGIVTKHKPATTDDSYFKDNQFELNKLLIDNDINELVLLRNEGKTIVFPKDGIGTGLAKLKEKAPKTFEYLNKRLLEEFGFDNTKGVIVSKQEIKPIEISSNTKGIGAALTNPTEISKSKGNIAQSYPITYKGVIYKDAEAAYQALKDKEEAKTKPSIDKSKNYQLMIDIIKAKLEQYPRLANEITKLGGSDWILKSTHQPTTKNTIWETGGDNWFIKALNDAYSYFVNEVVPFIGNKQPKGTEPQVITNYKYNRFFKPKVIDSLKHIAKNSKDKNKRFIANLLIESGVLNDLELKTTTEDTAWIGKANGEDLWININRVTSDSHAESVLLEEATHHLTMNILSKKGSNLQNEAVVAIHNIYETIIAKVQKGEMKGFDPLIYNKVIELVKRIGSNTLTADDRKFLNENIDYYRLVNFDEFIFGLLKDSVFQKKLNDVSYDANKSLLDRLREIVIQILNDFYNSIGVTTKKDSTFDVAMKALFLSLDQNKAKDQQSNYNNKRDDTYSVGDAKVKETKEKVSRLLSDYDLRMKQIQSNIAKAIAEGNTERKELLKKRHDELKGEVDRIKEEASIDILKEISQNDFDNIELLLQKDSLSLQDTEYINTTLAMWMKINRPDYLLTTDKEQAQRKSDKSKAIAEIVSKARELKDRLLILEREYILKEANEISSGTLENKDLKVFSDVNGATSWFLDLTKSGQKFIMVLAKAMQSAVALAKLEGGKIQVQITDLVNNAKNSSLFKEQGYDALIDTDSDGNKTNELIKYETHEYWKKRKEYLQAITDAPVELKEDATKQYFEWIKKNHYITDIRKIYKRNENGTYKYEPDQDYLDKIRNREGDNYNNFLQEQKDLIEEYNKELEEVIKLNTVDKGNVNYLYIEKWIKLNDPLVYINNLVNGYKTITHEGKVIINRGDKRLNIRAKDEWKNQKYQDLQKPENKELKDFYDFYVKTMKELISFLPGFMKRSDGYKINPTTIAGIQKGLLDTVTQDGSKTAFLGLRDKLVNAFSEQSEVDENTKLTDIEGGKDVLRLRPKHLALLSTNKMDYDLGKVLNIFANEVLLFKHKSNTEDFIRVGKRIVENAEAVTKDEDGNLIKSNNFIKKTKELENVTKQLEATIKSWYGIGRDDKKGGSFKVSWLTNEDKAAYERELKELREDKEYLEKYTDEQKKEVEDKLKDKYRRFFSFTNSIDSLLKYVQIKGMGWNPFSGITNYIFGEISNITYAAGGTDFNEEELRKARFLVLSDRKKVESLMIKYNVLKDIIDAHYKNQTDNNVLGKGLEWFAPFQLHKLGEYQVQGEILVSMMLHKKIKVTEDGVEKEIPLYEAYDEKGDFKYKDTSWDGDVNNKQHNRKWLNFKLKVDQIIQKVHGNYNPDAPIRAKRVVLGRALMQFRSWIPEGIESRYGQRKYDEFLERDVEGRYRTAGRIYDEYGALTTLKLLTDPRIFFGNNDAFSILSITDPKELELVKENMKRNLKELYIKLSMTALALLIAGFDDDDDEDGIGKKARNLALNTIYRMGDDIEFYSSPIAIENITRNIIPASGLIVDGWKFLDAIYEIDEDGFDFLPEAEAGRRKGETKAVYRGLKLLPVTSGLSGLFNKMETTESFRK